MLNTANSAAAVVETVAVDLPVSVGDVREARATISRHLAATPLVGHPLLEQELGCSVGVKLENTHAIGSFKVRGALNLLAGMAAEEKLRGLVAATKGNHGQSLAYAAQLHGVACTVFVPERNNADKNAAMEALGAHVRVQGHDFDAARHAAECFAHDTGARHVHPAREPALIAGAGTAALEMIEQTAAGFDAIYVPVGGGSIAAATALVFKALSPQTRVVCVQAENAPAMHHAWHTGEERPFAVAETVADGLAVRMPVDYTLNFLRELVDDMVLVSEDEIYAAMRLYASTIHQMAEGAAAAALAGALRQRERLAGKRVGLILTGGNVEAHTLVEALTGEYRPYLPQAMPMYPIESMSYGY